MSVRDHFPAQARGILNRHLRECRARSLGRCLLETIFLQRLGEYRTDTFDMAVLSIVVVETGLASNFLKNGRSISGANSLLKLLLSFNKK